MSFGLSDVLSFSVLPFMLGVFSFCLLYVFNALFKVDPEEKEAETIVEEEPAAETIQAGAKGKGKGKGKGAKAKPKVKGKAKTRKRQIEDLVNDEDDKENQVVEQPGLLTEI